MKPSWYLSGLWSIRNEHGCIIVHGDIGSNLAIFALKKDAVAYLQKARKNGSKWAKEAYVEVAVLHHPQFIAGSPKNNFIPSGEK